MLWFSVRSFNLGDSKMLGHALPTTIGESYRLSHSGSHQGLALMLQAESNGLVSKYLGVNVTISKAALVASEKAKSRQEWEIVQPVIGIYNSRGLLDVTR